MADRKRLENEKKFGNWEELINGRRYWYELTGRHGWRCRYIKEVNPYEETTAFYQEIYDESGKLVEIHEKHPVDKGHRRA